MNRRVLVLACHAVVARVYPVRAEAIDGQCCLGSSHFEFSGRDIRPPGGSQITGNYDRHGSMSCWPARTRRTQIVMVLLHEETVRLARGISPSETWKRCKPTC